MIGVGPASPQGVGETVGRSCDHRRETSDPVQAACRGAQRRQRPV